MTAIPAALVQQLVDVQRYAEALRIVDFNERTQEFFCRACRYRDPLGPDGNKLHDDHCPWVDYVQAFGRFRAALENAALIADAGRPSDVLRTKFCERHIQSILDDSHFGYDEGDEDRSADGVGGCGLCKGERLEMEVDILSK